MNRCHLRPVSVSPFRPPLPRAFSIVRGLLLIGLVLPVAAYAGDRRSDNEALFSKDAYLDHVSYLASDALEGRGTGQEGIDKAAAYIADYFKECGVKPAGDDGTYFQNFTLKLWKKVSRSTRLKFGTDGNPARRSAKLDKDYRPFPFSASGSFEGDVVFVGYGIVNDDYNDYDHINVSDKVVLMMRRAPRFEDFGMGDMSFRSKASRANARDAKAILIVNPTFDEDGDKLYSFDESSGAAFGMTPPSYGVPMIHISQSVANGLLKAGGLPGLAEIEKKIDKSHKPMSAALKGVTVKGRVKINAVESPVRNIVGLIPGKGPDKDEYIILGAHYDHLGIRHKGEEGFDPEKDISNGADDNGSGTSLIMTMADAYTRGSPPNRSLLLMLFTGEERGLLGSAHFASHPTIDLKKAIAMLNFDMVGRLRKETLEVGGMKTGGFEEMVRALADQHGLKIKDGGGGRGPSDHTSFYNKDIPVLFFFTGLHKEYHQPTDDTPLLNIDGAIRIAKYAADIIDSIDAEHTAPQFAKDNRRPRIGQPDEDEDEDVAVAAAAPGQNPHEAPVGAPGPRSGGRVRLGIRPDMGDADGGILIGEVMDDTPAARAGLKPGDRLKRLGGKEVENIEDLMSVLGNFKAGDDAFAVVERNGRELSKKIQFGEPQAIARAPEPTRAEPVPDRPHANMKDAMENLDKELARARSSLSRKQTDLDHYRRSSEGMGVGREELREKIATLTAIETELAMDMDGKRTLFEQLQGVKPEDMPITPDLQRVLRKDKKIQMLEEKLADAEEKLAEVEARHGSDEDIATARKMRDFAADRVGEERAAKTLRYMVDQIDLARRNFLEAQAQLLSVRERLATAQAESQDKEQQFAESLRLQRECDTLQEMVDSLSNQHSQLASIPRIAQLATVIRDSLVKDTDDFEITIKFDPQQPDTTLEIKLRPSGYSADQLPRDRSRGAHESLPELNPDQRLASKRPSWVKPDAAGSDTAKELMRQNEDLKRVIEQLQGQIAKSRQPGAAAHAAPTKKVEPKPTKKADKKDPHANMSDDVTSTPMPPVRLGIMPSYGETEGEGYEITGVVEGGAAAKAGMKDGDRIYSIGGKKVTDVYSYMDALRKYKPGDMVPVVVLRDGKKIKLEVKSEGQKSKEAA